MNRINAVLLIVLSFSTFVLSFHFTSTRSRIVNTITHTRGQPYITYNVPRSSNSIQMNFFGDAIRFFTNLNKEASAKHILIKGTEANEKLDLIKQELSTVPPAELSEAFSALAAKVSECPSASRGGNLGTFKPGMMVREFDEVVFEKDVGVVHGPIQTQFGSHLILITRRYEGEGEKK